MLTLTVNLLKLTTGDVITFPAALLRYSERELVVRAEWTRARFDLGYVVFETGDTFIEYYYTDRWYTIYAIYGRGEYRNLEQRPDVERDHINRSALPPWVTQANRKGWYCNVARPAVFDAVSITSEDLALDLFVAPDRQQLLTLDRDEYLALDLEQREPATHAAALAALAELERMALAGEGPFEAGEHLVVTKDTKDTKKEIGWKQAG